MSYDTSLGLSQLCVLHSRLRHILDVLHDRLLAELQSRVVMGRRGTHLGLANTAPQPGATDQLETCSARGMLTAKCENEAIRVIGFRTWRVRWN